MLAWVLTIQVAFALASGAALLLLPSDVFGHSWLQPTAAALIVILVAPAVLGILRFIRAYRFEKIRSQGTTDLIDTMLSTSREWLWALDDQGLFTFSSNTSATMLGYQPSELIGKHCRLIIGPEDLAHAEQALHAIHHPDDPVPAGEIVRFRHRNGSLVWAEVSGRIRPATNGHGGGFEGTSRLLPPQSATEMAASLTRDRIRDMVSGKMVLTAFQPIRSLTTGSLLGAEALSRFVTEDGSGADYWFPEAAAVGLGADLEFAAITAALSAAEELPTHVYVSLNISPETCLDLRLSGLLERAAIPLGRIVLELTERFAVEEYDALTTVLAPLRSRGLRIAVDDAGSGFASMRHILQLRPEIIKLDRSLITGIHDNSGQRALGAAMVEFAKQIGATIVAEGIETHSELDAITTLGMTAGQGYLLGRPSIQPKDWTLWRAPISSGGLDQVRAATPPGPRPGMSAVSAGLPSVLSEPGPDPLPSPHRGRVLPVSIGGRQVHELHAWTDPECVGKVHDLLADMWATSTDVSEVDQTMFETAVIEIAANIVQHGIDEGTVNCNLILEVYPDRLDAHFKDDGVTAAHVDIGAACMPDAFAETGRGLAMAKAAVDVLTYKRRNGDNFWKLSRTRTPA